MDVFDKAGKAVGDVIAKARERERVRLEDRLRQLDRLEAAARTMVVEGKRRAGYTWDLPVEESRYTMIAAATTIDDSELTGRVDELVGIDIPISSDTVAPVAALDGAFRAVVARLAAIRREALADD
ncbi:MAG: hypothetical protein EPO00_09720 [Chloroflexota bacterium]|nr:MAG: hypothetical protein EPO00_09720 [Chloroflexota bacterium]